MKQRWPCGGCGSLRIDRERKDPLISISRVVVIESSSREAHAMYSKVYTHSSINCHGMTSKLHISCDAHIEQPVAAHV